MTSREDRNACFAPVGHHSGNPGVGRQRTSCPDTGRCTRPLRTRGVPPKGLKSRRHRRPRAELPDFHTLNRGTLTAAIAPVSRPNTSGAITLSS